MREGWRMRKKVRIILVALTFVVASASYYLYNNANDNANDPMLILYGNVAIRDVPLAFQIPGRIVQLNFEEGDAVAKGSVVAVLDKGMLVAEIALHRSTLEQARVVLRGVAKTHARQQKLVRTKTIPQADYDNALTALNTAEAQVKTAEARVQLAQLKLSYAELFAPSNGTIVSRVREAGAVVPQGATVYTLALTDPVWVRTYVDEPDLGHLFPGQTATVTTDTGDKYTGTVGFISPQAEFTPKSVETTKLRTDLVYRVRVIVQNPDQGLRQGMPVTVAIQKRATGDNVGDNTGDYE